ncbi:MAG: hypothetical protein P9M14_10540 [Candidatus Alcyoniella australis]|nr:hypothetical protein [Candidatus Alcyoniella australis]
MKSVVLTLIALLVCAAAPAGVPDLTPEAVLQGRLAGDAVLTNVQIELWSLALAGCGCESTGANELLFGREMPLAAARCNAPAAPPAQPDRTLALALPEREDDAADLIRKLWVRTLFRMQLLRAVAVHRQTDGLMLDDALLQVRAANRADLACADSLDTANRFRTGHTIRAFAVVRSGLDRPAQLDPLDSTTQQVSLRGDERLELIRLRGLYVEVRLEGRRYAADPRLFVGVVTEIEGNLER